MNFHIIYDILFVGDNMSEFKQRNIDKFFCDEELIVSNYYKKDMPSEILVASDIHYHSNVDKELYKLLVKYAAETKPDFILMPGDLIETINFIDNVKERDFFESIIRGLAEIAPVIIVPGNHEIGNFDIDKCVNRDYSNNTRALRYLDSLNRIKNVYFLNNEQTKIKDVMFLGFNPRLATYLKKDSPETNEMFMEDYIRSGLKMAEADYNLLSVHNPIPFFNKTVKESISDFKFSDLVVSGHLHDGYLPKNLDKYLGKTNAGLFFTPLVAPIPGIVCRGVHDFGRGYIFISQGFRKWTADIGLFNAFEKFTANDVEKLIISNPEILVKNEIESKQMKF